LQQKVGKAGWGWEIAVIARQHCRDRQGPSSTPTATNLCPSRQKARVDANVGQAEMPALVTGISLLWDLPNSD
jgi:hypothetical protein